MSTIFRRVCKSGHNQYYAAVTHNGKRHGRTFGSRTSAINWATQMESRLQQIKMEVEFNEYR